MTLDFAAKRRKEIVSHARHVGAGDTDYMEPWLVAWVWHNPKAKDQIWSVMEAAKRMGGSVTEAEASAITEEASVTRKHLSADNLARFLGLTYRERTILKITTIGACDFSKAQRRKQRKHKDRLYQERKRRDVGAQPQSESLSATKPWEDMNMSRRTWYRRNKGATGTVGTTSSAPSLLIGTDEVVPLERKQGLPSEASPRRKQEDYRLADGSWPAVDATAPAPKRYTGATAAKRYVLSSDPTALRVWHGYTKVPLALRPWGSFPREFWRARQIVAVAERAGRAA
jgi:hypothetical protein